MCPTFAVTVFLLRRFHQLRINPLFCVCGGHTVRFFFRKTFRLHLYIAQWALQKCSKLTRREFEPLFEFFAANFWKNERILEKVLHIRSETFS